MFEKKCLSHQKYLYYAYFFISPYRTFIKSTSIFHTQSDYFDTYNYVECYGGLQTKENAQGSLPTPFSKWSSIRGKFHF